MGKDKHEHTWEHGGVLGWMELDGFNEGLEGKEVRVCFECPAIKIGRTIYKPEKK